MNDLNFNFVRRVRAIVAAMWFACQSASCDPRDPIRRRNYRLLDPEPASALADGFSSAALSLSCRLKIFLNASISVVTSGPAAADFSRVIGVCRILFTMPASQRLQRLLLLWREIALAVHAPGRVPPGE